MLQAPCPRCGEPTGDPLCGRCAAYLLRFDPFLLRPGLPGPSIDREVPHEVALLTFDTDAPVRFVEALARREDEAFALQFLNHVGLPDGGKAVLTRGDREVLHRLLRRWALEPPQEGPALEPVRALYAEIGALPDMPPAVATQFQVLAKPERTPALMGPEPTPSQPEPESEPEELSTLPMPPPPRPPPPPSDWKPDEWKALEGLKSDLVAKKDELARWLADQQGEVERREGALRVQTEEVRRWEAAIAQKERAVAEETRRLREHTKEVQRGAAEAGEAEAKRRLFFLVFSREGVSRDAAVAIAEAFVTEDRLRAATEEEWATIPGVSAEQASALRDAFADGATPPHRDLREKAHDLLEAGRPEAALEVFEALIEADPEKAEVWFNRGEVLAVLGRPDDAATSYERVLALEPDHRGALGELANLLFEHGEFGMAAASLHDLLRKAPDHVGDWLTRAAELLADGKATEATLIYNAILEADPYNLPASLALGDLLLAMGDTKRADRQYARALQHHPDSPEALLKKGLLLNRQGRWGAAIQMFNRAISLQWNYPEVWAAKGQVLLAQGKPKEAIECFGKLLALDDTREDGWLGKAEAHLVLGENDKAVEAAARALAINDGNRDVQDLLERLREAADRPQVEPVDVAALPPPVSFDLGVLLDMANALLDAGNASAALRGFNQVLDGSEGDASAWFGKGRALHALDRYEEALASFEKAREFAPENEEYLRWLVVCRERVRKEAVG